MAQRVNILALVKLAAAESAPVEDKNKRGANCYTQARPRQGRRRNIPDASVLNNATVLVWVAEL